MSQHDVDRALRRWLADGPDSAPTDVVTRALAEARAQPQARVINLPWRGLRGTPLPRPQTLATALSVALVVVAVVAGLWLYPRLAMVPAGSPSPRVSPATQPVPSASPIQIFPPLPTLAPGDPTAPTPPTVPTFSPGDPTAPPLPTLAPGDPTPSPRADLPWQRIGSLDGDVEGLLAADFGYVAYGQRPDGIGGRWPMAWFSSDGTAWEPIELAEPIAACPGDDIGPDAGVEAGATDGSQIVLVGWRATTEPDCRLLHSTAWTSNDGRSWTRSEPFGPKAGSHARLLWATEGVWEAAAWADASAPAVLWRSSDGLAWTPADTLSEDDAGAEPVRGAAEPLGQRVLAMTANGSSYLITSADPFSGWVPVDGLSLPPDVNGVEHLLAASDVGPGFPWLLVHDATDGRRIWVSDDGQQWQPTDSGVPYLSAVAPTRYGFLRLPEPGAPAEWGTGPMTSYDGLRWTALMPLEDSTVVLGTVVDGPAGVIAIEDYVFRMSGSVWRLGPAAQQDP